MTVRDEMHKLFSVREPHELPARMAEIVKNPDLLSDVAEKYKTIFPDINHDYMRDYFQDSIADRSNLMQDYTPESICTITANIIGEPKTVADLCAGTGSLTIGVWQKFPDAEFICYEISSASVPFLLFNLAIRGISAHVVKGDLLTEEFETVYRVKDGSVSVAGDFPRDPVDAVISNPPYSLKWSGQHDYRFGSYETPPKSAADTAFILIGLSMVKESGSMAFVLPHGVLFRGNQEGKIRKQLLQANLIHTIIGTPDNLFANTNIPVCVLVIRKTEDGTFVINADELFRKEKSKNVMDLEHVETVLNIWRLRKGVEDLNHLAKMEELEENDFNLNIPRYVNRYHPEPVPAPNEVMKEILETEKEIKELQKNLYESMVTCQACQDDSAEWSLFLKMFKEWANV